MYFITKTVGTENNLLGLQITYTALLGISTISVLKPLAVGFVTPAHHCAALMPLQIVKTSRPHKKIFAVHGATDPAAGI